jgi:peptidoglycan/LPS O-acetylase OafA/YrhL
MIFQLYLIFPLIWRFVSHQTSIKLVIGAAFGLQLAGFELMQALGWSDQTQYTLFSSWLGYFVLGVVLSQPTLPKYLLSKPVGVGLFFLATITFVWTVFNAHMLETTGANIIDATRFTRLPVLVYAATAVFLALTFKSWLQKIPGHMTRKLAFVGRYSYLIFLSHTLLLRILIELSHQNLDFPAWATSATAFLLAIHLSTKFTG